MRLLLVDDDRIIAELVRAILSEDGYEVDVAVDVREARRMVAGQRYDAILLDVVLPDGTGFGLLGELRAMGVAAPILMLTSRDREADVVQGLDGGADDYVKKPVQPGELRARLRAALRRASGAGAVEPIRLTGLTVDRLTRTVTCGGRRLRLTPKEYLLLEYLALNRGRTVPRAELLDKLWNIRFDPGSNVVDTHVARLRAKLEGSGAPVRVVTVRGTGFELEAG